jgi:hypothetical protein
LVVVLARIYSDTSPPKRASFLPPLSFSFQRAKIKKLISSIKCQDQAPLPHTINNTLKMTSKLWKECAIIGGIIDSVLS